ncbi:MAG: enoyl-CoA hydratase/isomerase family protein, partial [Candidatus Eremiobacteraeota bacterium]|nr:enoyl-CoA hydratase/isomerase family protein [Candidatus Eremiobacteraeota bacterium]
MLATTPYRFLLTEASDGVAVVTLNRPDKRNALSNAVMLELIAAFEAIGDEPGIKAVILRGVGPAFSAGHDLREMLARSVEEYRRTFDICVRLMETIQAIPQPVIAEVAGIATAAGCQLVATCDLAIASSAARFATPGVKIGLFCTTPMVALTRAVGRKRAMEMLLTGEMIDAPTAADWGLVNRVVAPETLADETRALAEKIASSAGF